MANVICFDLEGPLSPQDNAYEVMGLFHDGHRIFEVISRYDDLLTLEGREGYEPGDTLSLILPFLLHHGITEEDISRVSDTAKIVDGADYVIMRLKRLGWSPYIISTSYQQHAYNVGKKIGVSSDRIHCTRMPLDSYRKRLGGGGTDLVEGLEKDILVGLAESMDDGAIKERLDAFYYQDLLDTELGEVMAEVSVVGGQRKVDAAEKVAKEADVDPSELVVVGDSITDYKMLGRVRAEKGVAVAFNANRYAIPYANVGLATVDMRFLLVVIAARMCGGLSCVFDTVSEWEENWEDFVRDPESIPSEIIPDDVRAFLAREGRKKDFFAPRFHILEGASEKKVDEVVEIHSKSRAKVRGDAAKLG